MFSCYLSTLFITKVALNSDIQHHLLFFIHTPKMNNFSASTKTCHMVIHLSEQINKTGVQWQSCTQQQADTYSCADVDFYDGGHHASCLKCYSEYNTEQWSLVTKIWNPNSAIWYKVASKSSRNYCLLCEMVRISWTLCYQNLKVSMVSRHRPLFLWHQWDRAVRGSSEMCHFSFLNIFHE